MRKLLLLLAFIVVASTLLAQPPPPPPPPLLPPGVSTPIDTDLLYFLIPAVLFAVYRLNKNRAGLITDLK